MKQILITGQSSYIGNAVSEYLKRPEYGENYKITKISLRGEQWQNMDFSCYDAVLHVAGRAHADVSKVSSEERELYYRVNAKLAGDVAAKSRKEGVSQFIYLSSVIVYGDSARVGEKKHITEDTPPAPANFYGDSKLLGEKNVTALADDTFRVAVLRLPMVYGKNSKGNYTLLEKIAAKVPAFPDINNERSMLYAENLAEFIRKLVDCGEGGLFHPQNDTYVTTGHMVREIASAKGKKVRLWRVLNPFVWLASRVPGKIGKVVNKAFGSLTIDHDLSGEEFQYQKYSLKESIGRIHED